MNNILFTARSPLGYNVVCESSQWENHIVAGHRTMRNKVELVEGALESPDSIWSSGTHPETRDVYFAYNAPNNAYTKVVVEEAPDVHSVVSAWIQKEVKGNIGELKYVKPKL
jgi:hypothetical protein